jgi:hypothetical protein
LGSFQSTHFHIRSKARQPLRKKSNSNLVNDTATTTNNHNHNTSNGKSVHLMYYIHIIEAGKVRLHQCLYFLYKMLQPYSFLLLYCHTDNLVLALADQTIEKCVNPIRSSEFQQFKSLFLTEGDEPGCLRKEWDTQNDLHWLFISPRICTYILLNTLTQDGYAKFSSLNNVPIGQLYQLAKRMLYKQPCYITQERRVCKYIDRKTEYILMKFL